MTFPGDSYGDMERFALDPDTAERLLSGALEPEDAPHRYGEVASLLRIASGPTSGTRHGEEAAVAAVVGAIRSSHSPAPARSRSAHPRLKVATAGVVALFTLTGGLAAADALPGPAQEVAHDALAVVGVHVPNPSGSPATPGVKPADVSTQKPASPTLTTLPVPVSSRVTVPANTTRTTVAASTTSVSVSSQPGAGAGRTDPTARQATNPQSGAPQGAPAPTGTQDPPSAAPTSPAPRTQAAKPGKDGPDGMRAGPRRGNRPAAQDPQQ